MRIKIWAVTGLGTVLALTALGIVVAANDPTTAGQGMMVLFWVSLALSVWGALTTIGLAAGMNLTQGLWVGLTWAVAVCGAAGAWRTIGLSRALMGAVLLATLVISVFIGRRFRNGRT